MERLQEEAAHFYTVGPVAWFPRAGSRSGHRKLGLCSCGRWTYEECWFQTSAQSPEAPKEKHRFKIQIYIYISWCSFTHSHLNAKLWKLFQLRKCPNPSPHWHLLQMNTKRPASPAVSLLWFPFLSGQAGLLPDKADFKKRPLGHF